jgi:hypothetical protein
MTLIVRPGFQFDTDASTYIEAVEVADAQALETATRYAINNFVIGCKQDGIWSAIKASCILAGARTLTGALVPLVGTAPTNNNFVSGDYNRKTGLGDASNTTKYLNSNRNNNADPQDSKHISVYVSSGTSGVGQAYIGADASTGASGLFRSGNTRNNAATLGSVDSPGIASGLFGASRSASGSYTTRYNANNKTHSIASETPVSANYGIYAVIPNTGAIGSYSQDRLAFYSIGESLDLALLDARVTTLVNAFGAAIP